MDFCLAWTLHSQGSELVLKSEGFPKSKFHIQNFHTLITIWWKIYQKAYEWKFNSDWPFTHSWFKTHIFSEESMNSWKLVIFITCTTMMNVTFTWTWILICVRPHNHYYIESTRLHIKLICLAITKQKKTMLLKTTLLHTHTHTILHLKYTILYVTPSGWTPYHPIHSSHSSNLLTMCHHLSFGPSRWPTTIFVGPSILKKNWLQNGMILC